MTVIDFFTDLVLSGEIRQGMCLSEQKFIDRFNEVANTSISRTTVREGFSILAEYGILEQRAGKPTSIPILSDTSVNDCIRIRRDIEKRAFFSTMQKIGGLKSEEKSRYLQECNSNLILIKSWGGSGSAVEFFRSDLQFHVELARVSGILKVENWVKCFYLRTFLSWISPRIYDSGIEKLKLSTAIKKESSQFHREHKAILDFLIKLDSDSISPEKLEETQRKAVNMLANHYNYSSEAWSSLGIKKT